MKRSTLELITGLLVIVLICWLTYLAVGMGRAEITDTHGYELNAAFYNTGGLRKGATVTIAGVEIGRVTEITLKDYEGHVRMTVKPEVVLPIDSVAVVKTTGLVGEKFIQIQPGNDKQQIQPGGTIENTRSAVDIRETIGAAMFGDTAEQ